MPDLKKWKLQAESTKQRLSAALDRASAAEANLKAVLNTLRKRLVVTQEQLYVCKKESTIPSVRRQQSQYKLDTRVQVLRKEEAFTEELQMHAKKQHMTMERHVEQVCFKENWMLCRFCTCTVFI